MKLGDMQSVLQISVALNLAYFSFREIRAPAFSHYDRAMKKTDDTIARALALYRSIPRPAIIVPCSEETNAWIKGDGEARRLNLHILNQHKWRDPYSENMYAFDRFLRLAALIVGTLAFALLVLCSALSANEIAPGYFLFITAFCLTPTILAIFYNWQIMHLVEGDINTVTERGQTVEHEMKLFVQAVPSKYFSAQDL